MSVLDILTGRRIEELKERMQKAITCEEDLIKEMRANTAKLELVIQALNSHKESLTGLLNELKASRGR